MAEYHYKYNYDPSGGGSNKNSGDELMSWIVILITLAVIWPVGLFLLFRKLMSTPVSGGQRTRRSSTGQTSYNYHYTASSAETAQGQAQQAQPQAQAQKAQPAQPRPQAQKARPAAPAPAPAGGASRKAPSPKAGRGFLIGGGILTGVFGFSLIVSFMDALATGTLLYDLSALTTLACLTGIGLVLLFAGGFRRRKARLFRKYLALIGRRDAVSITTLAKASGRSYKKVCDDLQEMLDLGILPMGYLDLANDKLIFSSQGIADEPVQEEDAPEEEESPRDDNAILSEIRAVNDSISDPDMSAKIDRIGEITGKILDYQRKNPSKEGQLRSFLSYYLPTTLKILRAYAQLEEQGIEGENISAAKTRIEGMMDKVVEGFEKQLDKLFQDDALDITTDVAVLEKMLDKDGLGHGGMTLGA